MLFFFFIDLYISINRYINIYISIIIKYIEMLLNAFKSF